MGLALAHPEKSSRQLAWKFTDEQEYFISESSVYRILKGFNLGFLVGMGLLLAPNFQC